MFWISIDASDCETSVSKTALPIMVLEQHHLFPEQNYSYNGAKPAALDTSAKRIFLFT